MPNICDHTSVGMLVWKENKLLLIERGREPFGFAIPAGHVDGDTTFEAAAIRELEEETGLQTESLELLTEGRKDNFCRRDGGSWHFWKLYTIISKGEINPSKIETKSDYNIEHLVQNVKEKIDPNSYLLDDSEKKPLKYSLYTFIKD